MKGKLSAYVKIKNSTQQLEYNIGAIPQQIEQKGKAIENKREEVRDQSTSSGGLTSEQQCFQKESKRRKGEEQSMV